MGKVILQVLRRFLDRGIEDVFNGVDSRIARRAYPTAIRAVARGNIVRILVSDSGIGVPAAEKDRISHRGRALDAFAAFLTDRLDAPA